jgi:hypothetical protein
MINLKPEIVKNLKSPQLGVFDNENKLFNFFSSSFFFFLIFCIIETLRMKLDGKEYDCSGKKNAMFGKRLDPTGCFFTNLPPGKHILEVGHDEEMVYVIHLIVTW